MAELKAHIENLFDGVPRRTLLVDLRQQTDEMMQKVGCHGMVEYMLKHIHDVHMVTDFGKFEQLI